MQTLGCVPGGRSLQKPRERLAYVGTYTNSRSEGIYACRFSTRRGELRMLGLVAKAVNPSFLCVHPTHRFLYAVGEVTAWKGQTTGLVAAYAIETGTGRLALLNQAASGGAGPCHVATDNTGTIVAVANYTGGSVAVLRVKEDGSLGEVTALVQHSDPGTDAQGRSRPHPHGVFVSRDNRFVVVPDLGLNRIFIYRLDAERGSLEPADQPFVDLEPGAGPRHFVFHPSLRHGYSLDENRSTVTAFHYDCARGSLRQFDVAYALPSSYHGHNMAAEVEIDREGKFLYSSNRGADSIAVFMISAQGSLSLVEHVPAGGRTPRHFAIDPSGGYLLAANQESGTIVLFRIDRATGRLTAAGRQIKINRPACVAFAPADI